MKTLRLSILLLSLSSSWATFDIPSTNRITWEGNVGIEGGLSPRATIFTTLSAGSSNSDIQTAIDSCPSNQVVKLGAGNFTVTGLQLKDGVTLRGSGPTNTFLIGNTSLAIYLDLSGNYKRWFNNTVGLASGYTKGSTSIVLSSDSDDIATGTFLKIYQSPDTNFVNASGIEGGPGGLCMGQIIKVTNKSGTTLTIDPPLYWTYQSGLSPTVWITVRDDVPGGNYLRFAGVEDLCITNQHSAASANIRMQYAANCWVKNVRSADGAQYHVQLEDTYRCEIRESAFLGVLAPITSSRCYGINFGTTDNPNAALMNSGMLIENCAFDSIRTPIVIGYGASGNVIGYNLFTNTVSETATIAKMDIVFHSAHSMMNLLEGNQGVKVDADFFHGSSSHNVLFRNRLLVRRNTTEVSSIYGFGAARWSRWYSVIGNAFGYSGLSAQMSALTSPSGGYQNAAIAPASTSYQNWAYDWMLGYDSESGGVTDWDTIVVSSTLLHGNYSYQTSAQQWDSGYADHTLPNSLYYSGTPAWYPLGYTFPPTDPSTGSAAEIPAGHWYVTNNKTWDGSDLTGGSGGTTGGTGATATSVKKKNNGRRR